MERSYYASFALEAVVCRLAAYDVLPEAKEITIGSSLFTEDGQVPFAEGKTYLLFGTYEGPRTVRNDQAEEGEPRWEFPYPGEHVLAVDDQNDSGILSQYDGVSGNMLFSWRENREGAHIWRSPDRRFLAVLCRI